MNRYNLFKLKNHFKWCEFCGDIVIDGVEHGKTICREKLLVRALQTETGINMLAQAMRNPLR